MRRRFSSLLKGSATLRVVLHIHGELVFIIILTPFTAQLIVPTV